MNDKQVLNALIKGMEGSKSPVAYGSELYLQLIRSDYGKEFKNLKAVNVEWKWWENPEDCLHILFDWKNGKSNFVETCVSANPLKY